jgi:hypothetical protein
MQYIKTPAEKRINLQSGMYCHVLDNELVVNDVTTVEPRHLEIKLDKINSNNTFQYVLNIILTLGLIAFILFTSFFLFLPLFFVSLWHLRKLKQQTIPHNKSNCIPYKNIQKIELEKGKLGFNYLKIYIDNNAIQSLKILRLYDSESTYEQAKKLLNAYIIEEEKNTTPTKIAGYAIPLSETENYLFNNEYAYYTQNNVYELNKQDRYIYIRALAIFVGLILTASVIAKISLMFNSNPNYIDFVVLLFFAFLFLIPIKYSSKAVPNQFNIQSIQKIQSSSKKIVLVLKDSGWFLPLKIHFKTKYLTHEQIDFLKNISSNLVKK